MARKQARVAAMQLIYEQMEGGDGGEETLRGLIGFEPAASGESPEETPPETTPPEEIPETGQEWWPVWFMGGIGVLLVLLGLFTRIKERQ